MMIDNKDRKRKNKSQKTERERESGIELTTATVNNQKRQQN
jgi:hypothetical protein